MPLKLRVISDQYKELGKASSQLFGVTGGSIGRAPDNDWVLPDPDRYVSSHHARVSFSAGTWILEDLSTNGVFINDSDAPLSVTGPRKLKDGDRLRFGDYDIIVSIDDHSDFSPDASGQMPAPPSVRDRSGRAGRTRPSREEQAEYLRRGTFRSQPSSHLDNDLGAELDITGLLVSGSRDKDDEIDAVTAFDRDAQKQSAFSANSIKPIATVRPVQPASLLDNLLTEDEPSDTAVQDEWHMSTRRLQARRGNTAAAPLLQPEPDIPPRPTPISRPALAPQPAPKPIVRETSPPPRTETRAEARVDARVETRIEPARRLNDNYAELQAGVEALCRGAGIEPSSIPSDAHGTLLTLAGQMLREVVLDLMEALRTRSEEKDRLQMDQTAMQPGLNNPLKFAPSVEDALRRLLDGPSMRYMGAVDALREAFSDLKNHQLALDAGMHAALNDLLSRVDPAELQERFDRGLKRNPANPANNKAKYWELYSDFYPLLNQRDGRGWPAVFTEEFMRAYGEKLNELDRRRK